MTLLKFKPKSENMQLDFENDKSVFEFRMGQLISFYGLSNIENALTRNDYRAIKPESNSYWLTNSSDYNIIKLHLTNLELTVGSELFHLGCIVFFDLAVG